MAVQKLYPFGCGKKTLRTSQENGLVVRLLTHPKAFRTGDLSSKKQFTSNDGEFSSGPQTHAARLVFSSFNFRQRYKKKNESLFLLHG